MHELNRIQIGLGIILVGLLIVARIVVFVINMIKAFKDKSSIWVILKNEWRGDYPVFKGFTLLGTAMVVLATGFILFPYITAKTSEMLKEWHPEYGIMAPITNWASWNGISLIPLLFLIFFVVWFIWFIHKGIQTLRLEQPWGGHRIAKPSK